MLASHHAPGLALTTAALLGLAACRSGGDAPPAADPVDPRLTEVAWLTGTWRLPEEGGFVEETWLAPAGTTMLGVGATIRYGRTAAFEFLRIEARDEGLVYVAHPGGRSPGTEFPATQVSADAVRFENPEHDFPTWILYERRGPDGCTATVGGESERFELAYRRKGAAR